MKKLFGLLVVAIVAICALSQLAVEPHVQAYAGQDINRRNLENELLITLAREADIITIGRVLVTHSYWSADGTVILTDYLIQAADNLKSRAPGSFILTAEGGVVGDVGLEVRDEIKLEQNGMYALFLESREGRFVVLKG